MDEHIERAAVLAALEKINPVDFGSMFNYEMHRGVRECLREVNSEVEAIPAADVVEIRHGRWNVVEILTDDTQTVGKCSICSDIISWFEKLPNYCPNCGARMDKEDEHDN